MTKALGALMNGRNTLNLIQDESGRASILAVPIYILCGDRIKNK